MSKKKQERGHNSNSVNKSVTLPLLFNVILMEIDAFLPVQQQRIDTHSKEIMVKMCKPILQFTDAVTFCLTKPCLLNDASRVQIIVSQRVLGLDCGLDEEEFPNRSTAAIAVQGLLNEGSHYRAEAQKPFSKV
ncbi:hypothetical protein ElyMa_004540600 [Elysia marginata]|uniref:Uncharacterized protein n=1 Tax=Elysia marginata TaxID=1093978 RepID=A0AAV4HRA9_9GAST|nr:hypothetical protein ElyMa_004540600 [Elysia marginata]